MRLPRVRAAGTLSVLIVAAIAFTGSPANADDSGWIQPEFQPNTYTIPAHGSSPRTVDLQVLATGPYTNGTVTFDLSGLAGVATATAPDHCVTSGTTVTCPLPDVAAGKQKTLTFDVDVTSTSAAADGASGTITASTSADGVTTENSSATVTVKDAAELDADNDEVADGKVKPGDAVSMPLDLANLGSESAPGVQIVFDVSHGIDPAAYDNCLYAPWKGDNGTFVACTIHGTLPVNQQFRLHGGFDGQIVADSATFARTDAFMSITSATAPAAPTGSDYDGATFVHRAASGHNLTLDAVSTDGTVTPNSFPGKTWAFDVKTTNDIAAIGATVHGKVGSEMTITVGMTDHGPAALDSWSSHDATDDFVFTTPAWATVVKAPKDCFGMNTEFNGGAPSGPGKPGMKYYECSKDVYVMQPGTKYTETLTLKITKASGKDGNVVIFEFGDDSDDPNTANNKATVTLTSGSGGNPSPSPSTSGSASPSPSTSGTATGTPAPSATGSGPLPTTGGPYALIGGAGLLLILGGAGLVLVARRRRDRTA
jgi:hypothetical protein